jgi:putative glutamine amidotransferase
MRSEPLIGVPCDRRQIGLHPFHAVGEKYIRALVDAGVGTPLLMPSLDPPLSAEPLLAHFDGILLTGSPSNIEPHHYSDEPSYAGNLHDPHRDANTLSLIHAAVAARVPILAICRGFQEVNVAFGGTLRQKVQETPGFDDHREDTTQPLDVQYAPAHAVRLTHGGVLATIAGSDSAMVNSLHGQGVRTLGRNLVVEATAPDGLVEAFRLDNPDTFLLAVQWHPEWKVTQNLFYLGIFKRFAEAVRRRAHARI